MFLILCACREVVTLSLIVLYMSGSLVSRGCVVMEH